MEIPEAPVFRPTAAEWSDPMAYIKELQMKAGHAGICKIIPPSSWSPPFAIDRKQFRFSTRVQNLSKIDGSTRVAKEFIDKLRRYLFLRGTPMGIDPIPQLRTLDNGSPMSINLYRLLKAVCHHGGHEEVEKQNKWGSVLRSMNFHESAGSVSTLRRVYERYLLAYELSHRSGKDEVFTGDGADEDATRKRQQVFASLAKAASACKTGLNSESRAQVVVRKAAQLVEEIQIKREIWDQREDDVQVKRRKTETDNPPSVVDDSSSQELPETHVGAKFFKYFPDLDQSYQGTVVKRCGPNGKKWKVQYPVAINAKKHGNSHTETMDQETLLMYIASGNSKREAYDAYHSGICQICLRANLLDQMLLCDSCNSTYHSSCLSPPLQHIPKGDWFCTSCLLDERIESSDDESDTSAAAAAPRPKPETRKLSIGATVQLAAFGFGQGKMYTLDKFKNTADEFKQKLLANGNGNCPEEELARRFWGMIKSGASDMDATVPGWSRVDNDITVAYGSDLDTGNLGSGFPSKRSLALLRERLERLNNATGGAQLGMTPEALKQERKELERTIRDHEDYLNDGWNLNNLPTLNGSLLQYVEGDITGIMVPWLYVGMCFSSFCWHTEDHYFASINYLHWGEAKTWYGVPGSGADAFEEASRKLAPELFEVRPDILTGIVTMFDPCELSRLNVPVYCTHQHAGEFVVTFPRAYHGGFNQGFNCAEAVNFATPEWLSFGDSCVDRYKALHKTPVIAHESLVVSLAELCAQGKESVETAVHLLPSLHAIVEREKANRKTVRKLFGKRNSLGYDVFVAEFLSSGRSTPEADPLRQTMKRKVRKAQRGGPQTLSFGRARSSGAKTSRMSRMSINPGADQQQGNKAIQCAYCRCFCTLSFVFGVPEGSDLTKCACLEDKDKLVEELGGVLPRLVCIHPIETLVNLRNAVANRATSPERWAERFDRYLAGEAQPDGAVALPEWSTLQTEASEWPSALHNASCEQVRTLQKKGMNRRMQDLAERVRLPSVEANEKPSFTGIKTLLGLASKVPLPGWLVKDLRDEVSKIDAYIIHVLESVPKLRSSRARAMDAQTSLGDTVWHSYQRSLPSSESMAALRTRCDRFCFGVPADSFEGLNLRLDQLQDWDKRASCLPPMRQAGSWILADGQKCKAPVQVDTAVLQQWSTDLLNLLQEHETNLRVSSDTLVDTVRCFSMVDWLLKVRGIMDVHDSKHTTIADLEGLVQQGALFNDDQPELQRLHQLHERAAAWKANVEAVLADGGSASRDEFERLRSAEVALQPCVELGKLSELLEERLGCVDSCRETIDGMMSKEGVADVTLRALRRALQEAQQVGLSEKDTAPLVLLVEQVKSVRKKLVSIVLALRETPGSDLAASSPEQGNLDELWGPKGPLSLLKKLPVVWSEATEGFREHPLAESNADIPDKDPDDARFCVCRRPEKEGEVMVQCDDCDHWFHPKCVGLEEDSVKHESFSCKGCTGKEQVFCVCRLPYHDEAEMIACDCCEEWFHLDCLGTSLAAAKSANRGMPSFFCSECCIKLDIPRLYDTGGFGFRKVFVHYTQCARTVSNKAMLKLLRANGVPQVSENTKVRRARPQASSVTEWVERVQRTIPRVQLPEMQLVKQVLANTGTWRQTYYKDNLSQVPTRTLWKGLFAELGLPFAASQEVSEMTLELFLRFAEKALAGKTFEGHVPDELLSNETLSAAAGTRQAKPSESVEKTLLRLAKSGGLAIDRNLVSDENVESASLERKEAVEKLCRAQEKADMDRRALKLKKVSGDEVVATDSSNREEKETPVAEYKVSGTGVEMGFADA